MSSGEIKDIHRLHQGDVIQVYNTKKEIEEKGVVCTEAHTDSSIMMYVYPRNGESILTAEIRVITQDSIKNKITKVRLIEAYKRNRRSK